MKAVRFVINAVPIIAAVLLWAALLSTPVYTKAPHHTQVKIAALVAVAWLVLQLVAAAVTHKRKPRQQGARSRRDGRQQPYSGYSYPWQ